MALTYNYPGVYVEEIPSGVRSIAGVSTSVTAFVGFTPRGPVDKAVKVYDFAAFEREFGGLSRDAELGYAVSQFFLNGGTEAWIVRVADGAKKSKVSLCSAVSTAAAAGKQVLEVTARTPGTWGDVLRLDVDFDTGNKDATFNLSVTELAQRGEARLARRVEVWRNLSMDSASSQYAVDVVNAGSALVTLARAGAVDAAVIAALPAGWSLSGKLEPFPAALKDSAARASAWIRTWLKSKPKRGSKKARLAGSSGCPPD